MRQHLELQGQLVLDVGCGNGYFGWRMLGAGARCVVGIDPTVLFVVQWLVQQHFAGAGQGPVPANFVLPLKDTELPPDLDGFDTVFSMGVLYHRRDPAGAPATAARLPASRWHAGAGNPGTRGR